MRHLLDWSLLDDATWQRAIERAGWHFRNRRRLQTASDKSLGMLFFNNSLRTRTSMELAAIELGAHATTLDVGSGVWGFAWEPGVTMMGAEAEHISEAVGVLSRYYDALGVRVFATLKQRTLDETDTLVRTFASHASVPVVNLESAKFHPCQALADAATLRAHFGDADLAKKTFVLTWAPHPRALPQAVPNSALLMAARSGLNVRLAHPAGFNLAPDVLQTAQSYCAAHGTNFELVHEAHHALEGADVVYAKAWSGPAVYTEPEAEHTQRLSYRDTWRVTAERMAATRDAAFMHCLPVRRNVVVDDAVLDGPHAIHLLQAEHRLHAQKAILEWMWDLPQPA